MASQVVDSAPASTLGMSTTPLTTSETTPTTHSTCRVRVRGLGEVAPVSPRFSRVSILY